MGFVHVVGASAGTNLRRWVILERYLDCPTGKWRARRDLTTIRCEYSAAKASFLFLVERADALARQRRALEGALKPYDSSH